MAPPTIGPIAVVVHSTSWSSAFAVASRSSEHEVRQPGEHGRPEERVPDPGERREDDDRRRRARERQRDEDAEPQTSEPIISPLRESRSTSGPTSRPEEDGRQDVRDQQRADPPARVRAVVDVDLERDHREPVADARAEGREEEKPEAPVVEKAELATEIEGAHGRET